MTILTRRILALVAAALATAALTASALIVSSGRPNPLTSVGTASWRL